VRPDRVAPGLLVIRLSRQTTVLWVRLGQTAACLLVGGIVDLLHKSADEGTALPKLPSGHPLFKALSAHSCAMPQLVACFERVLTQPETPALSEQWLHWEPFISLALLDHGEGKKQPDTLCAHPSTLPQLLNGPKGLLTQHEGSESSALSTLWLHWQLFITLELPYAGNVN